MAGIMVVHAVQLGAQPPKIIPQVGAFECGFCEFIIFTAYSYITANTTESEIASIVAGICSYVPASYQQLVSLVLRVYFSSANRS